MKRLRPLATAAAAALLAVSAASPLLAQAKPPKIADAQALKEKVKKLYGEIDARDNAKREEVFVELDDKLGKKGAAALKVPSFWVEAIQESRFTGKIRKSANPKKLTEHKMSYFLADGKPRDVSLWYHGATTYAPKQAYPLLISFLPKGADPKTYLETVWLSQEEVQKNWIVAAVAQNDDYDLAKMPELIAFPFGIDGMMPLFNIDANRWYVEGVDAAAPAVAKAAATIIADRVAGLILRNPAEGFAGGNASLFPTVVVHAAGDEPAKAVVAAHQAVNPQSVGLEAADAATASGANPQIVEWMRTSPGRTLPTKYTWTTTLTSDQTRGEAHGPSIHIESPGKWDEPTKVTISYDKATNTIDMQTENLGAFLVYMNDELLDLDKPVKIVVDGKELANRVFERSFRDMFSVANDNGEFGWLFLASFRGNAPSKIAAPDAGAGKPADPPAGGK